MEIAAPAAHPAPQGVTVTGTPAGVQVSWVGVAQAAQYVIVRAPSVGAAGTPIGKVAPGTLTFVDQGFNAPAAYQVIAVQSNGAQGISVAVAYAPAAGGRLIGAIVDPRRTVVFSGMSTNPTPAGLTIIVAKGSALDIVTAVRINGASQSFSKVACQGFDGGGDWLQITGASGLVDGANSIELVASGATTRGSFTVARATISVVSPESAKPGEWVNIGGEHLAENLPYSNISPCHSLASNTTRPSTVTFNGYAGAGVETDGRQIRVQVPSHASGRLRVGSPWHGSAEWSKSFLETPVPTGVSLGSSLPGGGAFVTGTGLDGVDSVYLSNVKAPITSKTYDRLAFTVPATLSGPADYAVNLYAKIPGILVNFGTVRNLVSVLPIVKITSVSADSAYPGDQITFNGPSIGAPMPGSSTWKPTVSFNGLASPDVSVNSWNQVTAYVPNDATTGATTLSTVTGPLTGPSIRVIRTPRLSSMYPMNGQRVGQPIQIIIKSGSPPTAISFGGFSVTSGWTLVPDYGRFEIRMNLPAGALSGPVIVTTRDGSTAWTSPTPWTIMP